MNVFHHLKIVGGTVYDATVDIGFVQGVGQETSLTMTPDIDILCDKSGGAAVPVPTMTTIMGVTTVEEVDAMTNGASTTFRPRNIIPIPPFLLKVIVEMISRRVQDAKELLVKVVQEIKAFDSIHATDEEFRDKAKQKCKDFVYWIHLVVKNDESIKAIPTTGCNSVKVIKEFRTLTSTCLARDSECSGTASQTSIELGNQLTRPLEMLAASSSSNQEVLRKLTQIQTQSSEKTTRSFKKIPSKYQNMLQVASSIGEVTATEFFKISNVLNGSIMLNSCLEIAKIDCSISSTIKK